MNIFLNNNIIRDLELNDYEIATYVALRSIYSSARDTQFVSYNMITYELFNGKCTNTASTYIKTAFQSLVDKELVIVDSLNVETNKTKDMKNILANFKVERNVLIVVSELNDNLVLATRNLKNVLLLEASEINVLDLVSANLVIAEEAAIKEIEEALV